MSENPLAAVISAVALFVFVLVLFRKEVGEFWRRRKSTAQAGKKSAESIKRCVGYASYSGILYDDCRALRSSDCRDGRCSYHCRQNCKCEELDVPALSKYLKKQKH